MSSLFLATPFRPAIPFRPAVGLSIALIALCLVVSGCGRANIPNTTVKDTSENRDILDFVELYRKAVEARNVPELMSLASDRYYDDNGTPIGDDDIDREGLQQKLDAWAKEVLAVRYEIKYRSISGAGQEILVDYTYTGSFRVETPEGERWFRRLADNRLVLRARADSFEIRSGM